MEDNLPDLSRRRFVKTASAASVAGVPALAVPSVKPAALGGKPVRTEPFPSWPVWDAAEEKAVVDTLRSGKWGRGSGKNVARFESAWAEAVGAKHCLATASGTSALLVSLKSLGVGPGDEVILPPYTFVACVNVILMCHALPVFVDTDVDTMQIDARRLEAAITDKTAAIMPVQLGGATFDVDAVLAVAQKHRLPVIEDTCQSHFAEWKGRRTGQFGATGCFSFQASKNLNSGEGGAVLTGDDELMERMYTFHNNSRSRKQSGGDFRYPSPGMNVRMTEFQGALLGAQLARLDQQARAREQNAQYLTSMLKEIPGIRPARMHEGNTRNAYHLYMFRYGKEQFAGLDRAAFLKAMRAEGIPCSGGYAPLNKEPFLKATFASRGYQAIYSNETLARWEKRNHCPQNDRLCEEAVWFTQSMLLGARRDMDQIAEAIRKIQAHAAALKA